MVLECFTRCVFLEHQPACIDRRLRCRWSQLRSPQKVVLMSTWFDCLYRQMLRVVGRGKAVALLFAAAQLLCLANVGFGALLTAMLEKTVFSTESTVSMLGMTRISPVTQIFCTRKDILSKAMNRIIIAVLAHGVNEEQVSFPQRSAKTSAKHVKVTRDVPQHSTVTSAFHVAATRKSPSSKTHNKTTVFP